MTEEEKWREEAKQLIINLIGEKGYIEKVYEILIEEAYLHACRKRQAEIEEAMDKIAFFREEEKEG